MAKTKEKVGSKNCVLCSQSAGVKCLPLHGIKSKKPEIFTVLKMLLPPQDFQALSNRKLFSDPAICASCFGTLKKIPKSVLTLQGLLGKSVNVRLYKPGRQAWTAPDEASEESKGTIFNQSCLAEKEIENIPGTSSVTINGIESSAFSAKRVGNEAEKTQGKGDSYLKHDTPGYDDLSTGETVVLDCKEEVLAFDKDDVEKFDANPTMSGCESEGEAMKEEGTAGATFSERRIFIEKELVEGFSKSADGGYKNEHVTRQSLCGSKKNKTLPRMRGGIRIKHDFPHQASGPQTRKTKTDKHPLSANKGKAKGGRKGFLKTTADVVKGTRPIRMCTQLNKATRLEKNSESGGTQTNEDEDVNSNAVSDISASESDEDYLPPVSPSSRQTRIKTREAELQRPEGAKFFPKARKLEPMDVMDTGAEDKTKTSQSIPDHLSEEAKSALKVLQLQSDAYMKSLKHQRPKPVMIRCNQQNCFMAYPLWVFLARHIKYLHFDGSLPLGGDAWQKLSMLADGGKVNGKTYVHKCKSRGCELSFTSEQILKDHSLSHDAGRSLVCGFPDCPKTFRLAQSLKAHLHKHTQNLRVMYSSDTKEGQSDRTVTNGFRCDLCDKHFTKEIGLARHKGRIHGMSQPGLHKCPHSGCGEWFVKKEKLEIHLCEHSPERRLFCEKCGQTFSCQRYLDVHHKIHIKNEAHAAHPPSRNIPCEQEGCPKMFTTRENMKSHVLNQHRGRKPCAVPGVFFTCSIPGCDKKFSFRSTLYRHKKLVHKGGDYKLGCRVVKYPCTHDGGCGKVFNRKNLLEEHLVMEHGKSAPQRLLPQRSKDLDFTERICVHCGMVLTVTLLPRHVQLYHADKAERNPSESKCFPCHLEGCHKIFNTQEDRMDHVQSHIASPPYACQVEGCAEVFYVEKNLDNHLWNHSRQASTCDAEGCSQTFEDQLELAKHSRVHYNGKMKCPWPNCDNWLTEVGQLRPHFIAHSRAMQASGQTDYMCEVCQLTFSSRWGLMIHKRMHGEEAAAGAKPALPRLAKFSCEEPGCSATFCDQKGFFDHFLYHYTKKPCVCDIQGCNQSFTSLIMLSRHTKLHFDGKYQCPWQRCKKVFASPFIVKRHVYRHIVGKIRAALPGPITGAECEAEPCYDVEQSKTGRDQDDFQQNKWPLSCRQCFMVFRHKANLASHMEYHKEESEHLCPICGKKGKHNHSKAVQVGNKPCKMQTCDQCGASYATISGLKFHLLQKHKIGKWPFNCSYCGKGFVSSREMQRHIPSHTKEKPFVCDICGASFASHTGHRAHMRKHTGQKYVCEVEGCGKVYTTSVSLRGHMAQHAGFSKTCSYCNKTYKNPYGHKCKASREGKRKLATDSTQGSADQATQQAAHEGSSETSWHLLQLPRQQELLVKHPYHTDQPQPQYHHLQHQQVLKMIQPQHLHQQPLHQHHQQQQLHSQYVIPGGGTFSDPSTSSSIPSLMPGMAPQGPTLSSSSTASSLQQPQMILMAPQMLAGSSNSNSGITLMAIPHSGNSSIPLHHPPQHHPGVLPAPPPPPPPPPPSQRQRQLQVQASSSLTSSTAAPSASLPHINLLHQGVLTVPPHSSGLQQQQQQNQQHLNTNVTISASSTTALPEGMLLPQPERGNAGQPPGNHPGQGDYVYNNYVVFWEGQS